MNAAIRLILCAILCLSSVHGHSATIISPRVEQNGKILDIDSYFTSPYDLTIFLADELINGEWSVEILTNGDNYQEFPCWHEYGGKCIILPREYDFDNWNKAKRIYNETLNRDFFQFRVSFTTEYGEKDEIYLNWGLLPSRPIISDIEFTYSYNWDNDMIFPNGNFAFDVYSKDAKKFKMMISDWSLFDEPVADYYFVEEYNAYESLHINYEDADWGEHYYICAGNDFGYICSDVIYSNSYITDKDILKRIEELREASGVGNAVANVVKPSFRWNNSVLTFNIPIGQIYVYGLNGKLQYTASECDIADLSNLPKGIYIIEYQYKSHIYRTKISKL